VKLAIECARARLRTPFASAWGSIAVRELLVVSLEDSDGAVGFGEAAPLAGYDGVELDDVRGALEDCRALLSSATVEDRAQALAECARATALPQALAAIDLALWDLAGRRAGRPVWRLLHAPDAPPVQLNQTIATAERGGAARAAATARDAGFGCVKVKVGLADDAARVAAVRAAAGPELAIRLDANGCWPAPASAAAALRELAVFGIELCEEPVSGLAAIAELSALGIVPLALDESAASSGALERRVCDAVCLKIARCGGISGVLDAARRARAVGYEVYLASTLDGPLGIAAALHAAAALRPDRPCGLATLDLFERGAGSLAVRGGRIEVPTGPGLGEGLRDWYAPG
jgi:L-alanine-DL-glutamate epimerase-like enolase superfamily enzyme